MTALADIKSVNTNGGVRFAKAMLAVARLKGSDLEQFNDEHPRDAAGRFAAVGTGSRLSDPRVQRQARRRRRVRRQLKSIAIAETQAAPATEDKRTEDISALARLRQPRLRLERERVAARQERPGRTRAGAEATPKVDLNDGAYLAKEKDDLNYQIPRDDPHRLLLIDVAKYNEWNDAGMLVVGAANERWKEEGKPPLTAISHLQLADRIDAMTPAQRAQAVVIAIDESFHASTDNDDGSWQLSGSQILLPASQPGAHIYRAGDIPQFIAETRTAWDYRTFPDDYPDVVNRPPNAFGKAAAWEAQEHPRDPRSGRFKAGTTPVDPRSARRARAKRRQRRAVAALAVQPATREEQVEQLQALRQPRERVERRRVERGGQRVGRRGEREEAFGAPPPEPPRPKPKPTRFIPAGGEGGYGGPIVTEERFQEIEAAKKRKHVSDPRVRTTRSAPRPKPVRVTPQVAVAEIIPLGKEPRFLWDEETGELLNEKEIVAYQNAKRARAGKPPRAPS